MPKHLDATINFDPNDGETSAYISDARDVLRMMLREARRADRVGLGGGGPVDNAYSLIHLLSGGMDGDAEEYSLALFQAAANRLIDADEDLAHSI